MDTSDSLLDRLKNSPEQADWNLLVDLYSPLIRGWLRRYSNSQQDVDDVVQEVLSVVIRKLPFFERQRTGSFRSWLRTISVNCLRDSWRTKRFRPEATGGSDFHLVLEQLADPASELTQRWNEEHDQHVLHSLLDTIRSRLKPETWQLFQRVAIQGENATDVARELGTTVNAIYIARSRVMSQLRDLGRGILED